MKAAFLALLAGMLGGCASQVLSIRTVPDQTPAADNAAAAANAAAFAEAAAAESATGPSAAGPAAADPRGAAAGDAGRCAAHVHL